MSFLNNRILLDRFATRRMLQTYKHWSLIETSSLITTRQQQLSQQQKQQRRRQLQQQQLRRQVYTLLKRFKGSVDGMLSSVYPEVRWIAHLYRTSVPTNYWSSLWNQRFYLEKVASNNFLKLCRDWSNLTLYSFDCIHGIRSMSKYLSISHFLTTMYPQMHSFSVLISHTTPRYYWSTLHNQRAFLDDLSRHHLQVVTQGHWMLITYLMLLRCCKRLFELYDSNLHLMLCTIYPEVPWDVSSRTVVPLRYWRTLDHQFYAFERIARLLCVSVQTDWSHLTWTRLSCLCRGLLYVYPTLSDLFSAVYPQLRWLCYDRKKFSYGLWDWDDTQRSFLTKLQSSYELDNKMDWYRVYNDQLYTDMERSLKRGTFVKWFNHHCPDEQWDDARLGARNKRAQQRWLLLTLKRILPKHVVLEEYRHPWIIRESSRVPLVFDVFVPRLNMGVEFQGIQHSQKQRQRQREEGEEEEGEEEGEGVGVPTVLTEPITDFGADTGDDSAAAVDGPDLLDKLGDESVETQIRLDQEKKRLSERNGICLVRVPFYWDGKVESLTKIISQELHKQQKTLPTDTMTQQQ